MCFDDYNYSASNHFIQDLKENDPKLDSLLARARNDDGDALFAGSLVLLGGFELAPIDEVEATEWLRRGALLKHPACAVAYALQLHAGCGVGKRRDADRFVILGKKWLLDGNRDETNASALMLRATVEEEGLGGFRRSRLNAERLFAAAAEMGDPFGQFRVSQQFENESRRNDGNQEKARIAFRWARFSAEQGFASAQLILSIYLQNGFGTEPDAEASVEWLFKAARQHHPVAALEAGYWRRTQSTKAEPDSEEADRLLKEMIDWYGIAARSGLPMADIAIAYCHETGLGVEQNKALAYSLYHAVAHRDGRSFRTRLPDKEGMHHVRRRMSALRAEADTDRAGSQSRLAWGEDELIITESRNPSPIRAGRR